MSNEEAFNLAKSYLPTAVWWTVLVGVALATWHISTTLNSIDSRLKGLEYLTTDRWSATQMELWVARFQIANPDIHAPEVRSIPHKTSQQ